MKIEKLNNRMTSMYINYLKIAFMLEPEWMCIDEINEDEIKKRLFDSYNINTTSLVAIIDDKIVGRLEYHFYNCLQDGYKMAYVNWLYVLPDYRHQEIAQKLFKKFEDECRCHGVDEYFLLRSKNDNANRFYNAFSDAVLIEAPILRKILTK